MLLANRPLPPSSRLRGLKYWWPFDDVRGGKHIARELVQGAHGVPTAGTLYASHPTAGLWPITGDGIGAARFLEQTGYYLVSNIVIPAPQFTICCWFQNPQFPAANAYGSLIDFNGGGARLQLLLRGGGYVAIVNANANLDWDTTGTVPTFQPVHIALDWDGSAYHLTENGVVIATQGSGGGGSSGTATGNLGNGVELNFFRDVRIYDRGLSTAEIRMIYSEGFTPPPVSVERYALLGAVAAASGGQFRRTLSHLGTRTGSRQVHWI